MVNFHWIEIQKKKLICRYTIGSKYDFQNVQEINTLKILTFSITQRHSDTMANISVAKKYFEEYSNQYLHDSIEVYARARESDDVSSWRFQAERNCFGRRV